MKAASELHSNTEELYNAISHGIGAVAAIGGLVVLIVNAAHSDKNWSLLSALVYGSSLVLLYSFSALYHGLKNTKAKKIFNILDHCGIYLLIAGSYTPVVLISIGGRTAWIFFAIQWTMALVGIVLKIFYTGKYNVLSTLIYALMGWLIVFKISLIKTIFAPTPFWLLISGGLAYTLGIAFYLIDYRMKLSHFIWHLFVMAGSILHFILIAVYVI